MLRTFLFAILASALVGGLASGMAIADGTRVPDDVAQPPKATLVPPEIPEEWRDTVKFDQENNVPRRRHEILTPEEAAVLPVYHWDIPYDEVMTFRSKYLNAQERDFVTVVKDGKRFVRMFALDLPGIPFEELKKIYGEPGQIYWAAKMQAHSTYFVWDPQNSAKTPFFVKMKRIIERLGLKPHYANSPSNAKAAVSVNDYVERLLRAAKDKFASMLPERFGMALRNGLYAYSIRSVTPISGESCPECKLLPVHGILDRASPVLDQAARARGMTRGEWIQAEFLPMLARFLVRMAYTHGLHPAAHSQNLTLLLNEKTGKIVAINGRDMHDVTVDAYTPVALGGSDSSTSPDIQGVLNVKHPSENVVSEAGVIFATYAGQTVYGSGPGRRISRKRAELFLRTFIQETELQTGVKIQLSAKSEAALKKLSGPLETQEVPGSRAADNKNWTEVRGAIRTVTRDVHDQITLARQPRLTPEMTHYDPKVLMDQFGAAGRARRITFFYRSSIDQVEQTYLAEYLPEGVKLEFAYDGKGIAAYDPKDGKVYAYARSLTAKQKEAIERTRISPPTCLKEVLEVELRN